MKLTLLNKDFECKSERVILTAELTKVCQLLRIIKEDVYQRRNLFYWVLSYIILFK